VFHLTSARRWARIADAGTIVSRAELARRGVEKPPSPPPARRPWDAIAHELVWLTINPLPRDRWLEAESEHKGDVIVTVEPEAEEAWMTFARLRGFPERYLHALRELGNPAEWFVSGTPIDVSRWLRVQEGRAGHVLWERGMSLDDAFALCVACGRAAPRAAFVEPNGLGPLCVDCVEP
jgi:hypothetical protein